MGNKSIADFFADFRAENLLKQHTYEAACNGNAALSRVREQILQAGLKKIECALSGKPEEEYDKELERLEREEAETLEAEIKEPRYNCPVCKDTGTAGGRFCNCLLQKMYVECYGAVDIRKSPIRFDQFDLSLFDGKTPVSNGKTQRQLVELFLRRAQEYVDTFPQTARKNILLTGKAGLGKSFLLYCMAKRAEERGIDVLLIRAPVLFSLFHAHRLGGEVDLSYLQNAALLMIDDIGTEPVTQNVSNEYFYELIEHRMERGLHTVFATNADDIQKRYDDRIASRLQSKDRAMLFYFSGRDLRG